MVVVMAGLEGGVGGGCRGGGGAGGGGSITDCMVKTGPQFGK